LVGWQERYGSQAAIGKRLEIIFTIQRFQKTDDFRLQMGDLADVATGTTNALTNLVARLYKA